MKWKKYRLKTVSDAEDIIIATLYDAGIDGAEIEDKIPLTEEEKEQMFVDILPDAPDNDGTAYISFYLDEDEDTEAKLAAAKEALDELKDFMDIGEATIEESETEDVDWINNWKQYFKQFYVDDLLIIPSWEEVREEDKGRPTIHIDPGTAFGTGMHETTQLCIRQLKKYVTEGMEILDVGTGSGILSIAASMFGAKHAMMTDLDPCCINAVAENMEVNGVPEEKYQLLIGNIIDNKEVQDTVGYAKYDLVAANILAEVLLMLTPEVIAHMKPGCIYITSGIIADKEGVVVEAVKNAGLEILEVNHQGEWVSVTARKNA